MKYIPVKFAIMPIQQKPKIRNGKIEKFTLNARIGKTNIPAKIKTRSGDTTIKPEWGSSH